MSSSKDKNDPHAKHPLIKGKKYGTTQKSTGDLNKGGPSHAQAVAAGEQHRTGVSVQRPDANTVDSDEEVLGILSSKKRADGGPVSPIIFEPAPGVRTIPMQRSSQGHSRIDPLITTQDIVDLKNAMKEYSQVVRQDFLTIMSKLNTIELNIQTLQTDMEIFKKSSARFVSSGPTAGVSVARKFDW